MWRLVLTVVLWHTISSQPLTDEPQSRPARQVDFIECCPCPGSSRAGLQDLSAAATSSFSRADMDDCPCRLRDPDSEGSSSLFLPRAVPPVRPFVTPESPKEKEDIKPLLKPEVGLASSMLETLREVTDQEYQEALARDAARNAARVAELADAQPGTAKNVVTIIVNPRDDDVRDTTPEASQAFENRCAHPSGDLGKVSEDNKPSVFKLGHNFRSFKDMDNGASNVKESVVGLNKGLDGLRLKTTPSLLKLFPQRKSEGNIQSLLKLKNSQQTKNPDSPKKIDNSKLPKRKIGSIFKKMGEDESPFKPLNPLGLGITKLKIPKLRTNLSHKPKSDDNNPSPSIIQEFSIPVEENKSPFGLRTLLPPTPFNLANFLNLKDVELMPPKSTKITLPDLKLLPPLRINKPETKFVKQRKSERLTKKCNTAAKENEEDVGLQNNQRIHTEILDTIPHASEANPMIALNNNGATSSNINEVPKRGNVKTDILDAIPSASELNEFVDENGSFIETSTPRLEDETTNSVGDIDAQNFEETVTVPTNNFSKDNVENGDLNQNSMEFTMNNDGHDFEVAQETDQPITEIDITDSAFDGEGLTLEINEESTSGLSFSTENSESEITEELNEGGFVSEAMPETQEEIDLDINPELEFNAEQETEEIDGSEIEPVQQIEEDILFSQDSAAETSNQNIQLASLELTDERTDSNEPTGSSRSAELPLQIVEPLKSDLLSSLKERISIKLNSLKNPETKITISRLSNPATMKSSFDSVEFSVVEPLTQDNDKFIVDEKSTEMSTSETNQINMQDLQHMSDSLLVQSDKKTMTEVCRNLESKTTSSDASLNPDNSLKETILTKGNNAKEKANSDMESSATSFLGTFDANVPKNEDFSVNNESVLDNDDSNPRKDMVDSKSNKEDAKDNNCSANLQLTDSVVERKNEKSLNLRKNGESEMETGASETFFDTARMPGSPLLHQSIVVQPASLLPAIPSLDLSNVKLPTLDDIREGISNLLGENSRASEDEVLNFNSEECSDSDPGMSSDASTTNMKSAFPTLRPLEDINLDIFQINPQSLGSPLSKIPSLNLNSFRTKLALPKSLELKPMKLQSTLGGKNGGLFGASLTFGQDKTTSLRKSTPITNLGSILQGSDILRSPLSNLPSLDDIRATIGTNTGSLLKSNIKIPLEDTLKSTETLSNSLRSHTENTIRNIQQSLSSTLNEARVSNAGEKYAKPQDLLEKVALAHEDVKDKLYGIHVDLQDRLSSLHDDILGQTNLQIPTLQMPLLSGIGRLQESPFSSYRASNEFKKTPSPKLIVKKRKPTVKSNKPLQKHKEQDKVRPFKISKAASSLTPKSVEVPKLMATSIRPPFLQPLQRDENVKVKGNKPLFDNGERNISDKNTKSFASQSKVTKGTTPRPTSFRTNPTARPRLSPTSTLVRKEQPSRLGTQKLGQLKSFSDSRGFASELQATKVPAPFKPVSSAEFLKPHSEDSREAPQTRLLTSTPSKLPNFALKNPFLPKTPRLKSIAPIKIPSIKPTIPPLTLPRPTESPIVSKMRDSIRIRLSRPVHSTKELRNDVVNKSNDKDALAGSASEAKGVALRVEPMKENVSYKCKMVCVRE